MGALDHLLILRITGFSLYVMTASCSHPSYLTLLHLHVRMYIRKYTFVPLHQFWLKETLHTYILTYVYIRVHTCTYVRVHTYVYCVPIHVQLCMRQYWCSVLSCVVVSVPKCLPVYCTDYMPTYCTYSHLMLMLNCINVHVYVYTNVCMYVCTCVLTVCMYVCMCRDNMWSA